MMPKTKFLTFWIILFFITESSFSQVDEIKTTLGESIICKLDSINSTHVFYHISNEKKYLSKLSIDYIKYGSGRVLKIENNNPYPKHERESFIMACFQNLDIPDYDSINANKKLNYCISSLKSIESKIAYKDFLKVGQKILKIPSDELIQDFGLDLYMINSYHLYGNSEPYNKYQSYISEISKDLCKCVNQNVNSEEEIRITKNKCRNKLVKIWGDSQGFFALKLFAIFKDTSLNSIFEITGKTILNDVEKYLIFNCDSYFNFLKIEREAAITKIKGYNKDSLYNKLQILLKQKDSYSELYFLERGDIYFYLNNYDKAIEDFDNAIKLNPKGVGLFNKYELYNFLNEYEFAIESLKSFQNQKKLNFNSIIFLLEKLSQNQKFIQKL
jgi:tetratricopeptide (TPR) repeat protein